MLEFSLISLQGNDAVSGKLLGDMMEFDPTSKIWENLTEIQLGVPPSPRACHGFASASGKIYVHGGVDVNGKTCFKNM